MKFVPYYTESGALAQVVRGSEGFDALMQHAAKVHPETQIVICTKRIKAEELPAKYPRVLGAKVSAQQDWRSLRSSGVVSQFQGDRCLLLVDSTEEINGAAIDVIVAANRQGVTVMIALPSVSE